MCIVGKQYSVENLIIIHTMFLKSILICVFLLTVLVSCDYMTSDEEYIDDVINMLLNGRSIEVGSPGADNDYNEEPVLTGGIWKCGDCADLEAARLVYSESNEVDADMLTDKKVDIQIGLTLPDMKCVTVTADVAGVVRRVSGTCSQGTVTLSVSPAQHFTVQVYN